MRVGALPAPSHVLPRPHGQVPEGTALLQVRVSFETLVALVMLETLTLTLKMLVTRVPLVSILGFLCKETRQ